MQSEEVVQSGKGVRQQSILSNHQPTVFTDYASQSILSNHHPTEFTIDAVRRSISIRKRSKDKRVSYQITNQLYLLTLQS